MDHNVYNGTLLQIHVIVSRSVLLLFSLQCADFREFTEVLVFPMFGYGSFQDVFDACCPTSRIDDIHIPVLGLNAADDPFTPPHGMNTIELGVWLA